LTCHGDTIEHALTLYPTRRSIFFSYLNSNSINHIVSIYQEEDDAIGFIQSFLTIPALRSRFAIKRFPSDKFVQDTFEATATWFSDEELVRLGRNTPYMRLQDVGARYIEMGLGAQQSETPFLRSANLYHLSRGQI
jgi:hypothetical protein